MRRAWRGYKKAPALAEAGYSLPLLAVIALPYSGVRLSLTLTRDKMRSQLL